MNDASDAGQKVRLERLVGPDLSKLEELLRVRAKFDATKTKLLDARRELHALRQRITELETDTGETSSALTEWHSELYGCPLNSNAKVSGERSESAGLPG